MSKIKTTRKTSTAEVIAEKAALLFRQKGYNEASMRNIADALNIEAPSLYNHIKNKAELLQIICKKVAQDFEDNLLEVEQDSQPNSKKLERIIRFHIKMSMRNFDFLHVSNHQWKSLPPDELNQFLIARKKYETRLVQIVKDGILKKEFKILQPQVAVLTILSALRGLEFYQKYKKHTRDRSFENSIVKQLLTGIAK